MNVNLEAEIGIMLKQLGLTVAVAESATGGLISSLITDIPGSSDYFKGSVVSYDNTIKAEVLGVNKETLENYGAVSYQTAEEMALGVRKMMGTNIGLSDTGITGPAGATPAKPVGLFFIGLSSESETRVERYLFQGDRAENKKAAATAALSLLKAYLSEKLV
ncbi:CinA family protein [Chloroflexota bacterium]